MRVLIAEDDAVSRAILKRAVEKLGHECTAANDGLAAWEAYLANPEVDVIISDWMMPGLDGPALCEKVRGYDGKRDGYPFFIFLTALGDKAHLLEGMQAGADDYLSKPLDREELGARLLAATRVTSLHRQLNSQKRELERLNFELFKQARRDPLTKLGNRLRLREDLETLRARVERYGHSYSALLCDVDYFKLYNDTYGHLKGDDVLRRVAEVVLETFRTGDSSYRYGGEEFLAILPEQTLGSAAVAAERLRSAVEGLAIPHEGSPLGVVTVSCGLAELASGAQKTIDDLLKEADTALYEAKDKGKNNVAVYGAQEEAPAAARLREQGPEEG
ncbi:diguanylate cyclase [Rubrobacter marinus]|uniref:Diguanylate cyclase n=1 Tax=Rubrobacter marinus TaxID=2653852 RepID=A0A6G8PTA5_9ACTN|nr:diguanylate cyclase [Rubrobacter marinus]QIN77574.1 diguanylate cyclase [Rubrobacter marinus]